MNDGRIDTLKARVLDIASPIVEVMPNYHPDAADINEALDSYHGNYASCAARAYGAGLLIRSAFPNERLHQIDFGYDHEHGGTFVGQNGSYPKMGHAVVRLAALEQCRLVVETYNSAALEVVPEDDRHDKYVWAPLDEGYQDYLRIAGIDVEIDPEEVLEQLIQRIAYHDSLRDDASGRLSSTLMLDRAFNVSLL